MLRRYFRPEGRAPDEPYKDLPMYRQGARAERERLTMLACFVEVFLAKEGHDRPVGINLLTKIQLPTLASLYGAMLAGVDVVLMGAGIPQGGPRRTGRPGPAPACARCGSRSRGARPIRRRGCGSTRRSTGRGPRRSCAGRVFLPIVASNSLATMLSRKASGRVDGFIIEGPIAGGHNAPPRGENRFNARGEPIYGERDVVDLAKMAELGLPFWLAGGSGRAGRLRQALEAGAAGIQVGTLFAYCEESGLTPELKASVLRHVARGEVDVYTDPLASPTGFPFKVVRWQEDPAEHTDRARVCDLGYLRVAYPREDGRHRLPLRQRAGGRLRAEGWQAGGDRGQEVPLQRADGEHRHGPGPARRRVEPPLVTSGDDLVLLGEFLAGRTSYTAADAIEYLLSAATSPPA